MSVTRLSLTRAGTGLLTWRIGVAFFVVAIVSCGWRAARLEAQLRWRGRVSARIQYVEARSLVRDSVALESVVGTGTQRTFGHIPVNCTTGATHCYFYRSGSVRNTYPSTLDVDLSAFGFGVEGLRAYVSARVRTDFGGDEFWPRMDDNFDLLAGYLEFERRSFRVRVGRDYQVSGLGFYGYDGGSLVILFRPARIEFEAYGGWGLERGVPQSVHSRTFASLGVFQPQQRNYLFGVLGSVRPSANTSVEAVYQRETATDRMGIVSERLGLEATYAPSSAISLLGHADYDFASGWWGKAGLTAGWNATGGLYLEGRLFRYRPVFSLQTIWVVFSPVPYWGWGLAARLRLRSDFSFRVAAERRTYADAGVESPFLFPTTDRNWRVGGHVSWRASEGWDAEGAYWIDWGFGTASNSGKLRLGLRPRQRLSLGASFSAFRQIEEFRVGEGRVWGLGGDIRWRSRAGTVWLSIDRYVHDRRKDAAQTDWTQWRGRFGLSYYLGSEPVRLP